MVVHSVCARHGPLRRTKHDGGCERDRCLPCCNLAAGHRDLPTAIIADFALYEIGAVTRGVPAIAEGAIVSGNITKVASATDEAINGAHNRAIAAARKTEASMLDMVNEMLGCGLLLIERKKSVRHGEWCLMFASHDGIKNDTRVVFHFDARTGQRYMKLGANHPALFASWAEAQPFLRDAGIIANALPEPEREPQSSRTKSPIDVILDLVGHVNSQWKKARLDSLESISDEGKLQIRDQLEPLREKINAIWDALGPVEGD